MWNEHKQKENMQYDTLKYDCIILIEITITAAVVKLQHSTHLLCTYTYSFCSNLIL